MKWMEYYIDDYVLYGKNVIFYDTFSNQLNRF
jgi:hypothetical protein